MMSDDELRFATWRLWQAVLDASQVPEHLLAIAMKNPDPVARQQAVRELFSPDHVLPGIGKPKP